MAKRKKKRSATNKNIFASTSVYYFGALVSVLIVYTVAYFLSSNGKETDAQIDPSPYTCKACAIDRFLADESAFVRTDAPKYAQGMHLLCFTRGVNGWNVLAHANGVAALDGPLRSIIPLDAKTPKIRRALEKLLHIQKATDGANWGHYDLKQDWRLFTPSGAPLSDIRGNLPRDNEDVLEALLFEGGQFIWPGVALGHVHNIDVGAEVRTEIETISMQPLVFSVRNFLSNSETDHIISLAKNRMANSGVSKMDKDKNRDAKEFRTSTQAWVRGHESKIVKGIKHRAADLTKVEERHQEEVQVLRYELGQYYSAHLDAWDPEFYASDTAWFHHGHKNRLATVFWYVSDVEDGGETIFPRAGGLPQPQDMYSCEDGGLKVKPERGKVIIFYSLLPNGNVDPNSLHGACPVQKGQKWAANLWIWNKPQK